jgi:cell division protein ZapA (FtsZ GTPase activity inhibitor)
MPELIPVNILIGDRTYRIKIAPADEERLRKTVKFINDKILEFKTGFAGKDMQDYIAMAFLWFATEQHDNGNEKMMMGEIAEKIAAMEGLLDKSLNN